MVCSPHIGVLAGIARGYAPPRYNFSYSATVRYQKPSMYTASYQSTQTGVRILSPYQATAIADSTYNFQKKSQYNLQTNTNPIDYQQQEGKNKIFSASEQSYLPVSEAIAYQSPLLTALNQTYTAVIEEAQKNSAKNLLHKLIEKELEALQMKQQLQMKQHLQTGKHSQTDHPTQRQEQHQLYN